MELRLRKGIDLSLAGAVPQGTVPVALEPDLCAVVPDDFPGLDPKLEVKEGDAVMAGSPLLRSKARPQVKVASPVAGVVKAVVRGERRKIERVVVERAPGAESAAFAVDGIDSAAKAVGLLCASGLLACMRQRPYDIVPDPEAQPRDIFVTAIDSAPLACSMGRMIAGHADALAKGVALLRLATKGKVYLSVAPDWSMGPIPGAEMVTVAGKHPAGNAGVQAANIAPVNKGETIWCLDAVTLMKIGELMLTGKRDSRTLVALTGSEVKAPCLISTLEGAQIAPLVAGRLAADAHVRIISGNVLTGVAVQPDGFLRFPYRQITVIPEGDDADEFMGWASMSPAKMSLSRALPAGFLGRIFRPDARINGGRRAMIMSGEYDKYIPMDILPEYLIKAILAKDIEGMEKLGIYEVAPEDFALAEYADTSKLPLQQIVRDGLDYLRKELS